MKITILGSGTSTGVPVIACKCHVCTSKDHRNKRTRSSILVRTGERHILIDTSTDLRQQALSNGISRIDAALFTHHHADHIHGIDELRTFNMVQKEAISCYGNELSIERIERIFSYIFSDEADSSWKPDLKLFVISGPFELFGLKIEPVEVLHGRLEVLGYRIGGFAYITDCSFIPPESRKKLHGLDTMVLGVLRERPHPTHLNVAQALEIIDELRPQRTIFTHLSHYFDYEEAGKNLPDNVELGYDGMEIEIG